MRWIELTVERADDDDRYEDIVRIPRGYRLDREGNVIRGNSVCVISVEGKGAITAIVRGRQRVTDPVICMDEYHREELEVKTGEGIRIALKRANVMEEIAWAWRAANPSLKIAARLSILLGLAGLVLGVLSLLK